VRIVGANTRRWDQSRERAALIAENGEDRRSHDPPDIQFFYPVI
jgi:hypothetical protein